MKEKRGIFKSFVSVTQHINLIEVLSSSSSQLLGFGTTLKGYLDPKKWFLWTV